MKCWSACDAVVTLGAPSRCDAAASRPAPAPHWKTDTFTLFHALLQNACIRFKFGCENSTFFLTAKVAPIL